jgi:hypothetical protein
MKSLRKDRTFPSIGYARRVGYPASRDLTARE